MKKNSRCTEEGVNEYKREKILIEENEKEKADGAGRKK